MPTSYSGPNPSRLVTIIRPRPASSVPSRPAASSQVSHGPPANVTNPGRGGGGTGSGGGFKIGNPGCCCGSSVIVPGCPCTSSPAVIAMTSSKPASNNEIFQSARLLYGPTPSTLLPAVLLSSSYLSDTSYNDPILGAAFFYFLTCTINSYVLTRVYPTTSITSPFRDLVRYKWVPGFPGNDCGPPFQMLSGQIFLGGDATCIVTLAVGI